MDFWGPRQANALKFLQLGTAETSIASKAICLATLPATIAACDSFPRSSEPSFNDWQWHMWHVPRCKLKPILDMFLMRKMSLVPETRCNQWTSMQDLTDMAMALLCQYQQCNFSPPMRLQFLWKDGREILVLKASFRIRLVVVWNHLESTCNENASNSQKLEQGARLGQLCRYKRERTKTGRSSRWSLCRKVCICLKEPRRKIKRLLVKRATVGVSTSVRHSCMHLQGALRLSIWSVCENVQTSFTWSKISRSCLDAEMQHAERMLSSRPVVSKHIQTVSHRHQTGSFHLGVAALHFQMTDCSLEDLEVKSRWARTTTLCLPVIWWIYPARGCVV